jgi:hypothetical protein
MLAVNVSSNYKTLSRSLDNLGRKQLPFAFAKTLDETMKAVEKYTVARTYPLPGQRCIHFNDRAFPAEVINDVQGPETLSLGRDIVLEIHGPAQVHGIDRE